MEQGGYILVLTTLHFKFFLTITYSIFVHLQVFSLEVKLVPVLDTEDSSGGSIRQRNNIFLLMEINWFKDQVLIAH